MQSAAGKRSCRILSLDGGGTWCLIEVLALQRLYGRDAPGHTVLSDFDFVAANSGGSIVAAGLYKNMPLSSILQCFTAQSSGMFKPVVYPVLGAVNALLGLFGQNLNFFLDSIPRWQTEAKYGTLRDGLNGTSWGGIANVGDVPMCTLREYVSSSSNGGGSGGSGGSKLPELVIVAFDYDTCRAHFFRTSSASTEADDHMRYATLAQAVHASSTAPVEFYDKPAVVTVPGRNGKPATTRHYWDGGVTGMNNPVLAGVAEAIATGRQASDIAVLSMSSSSTFLPRPPPNMTPESAPKFASLQRKTWPSSFLPDLMKLAAATLDDPPDRDTYLAHLWLGGRAPTHDHDDVVTDTAVVRMSPVLQPILLGHDAQDARAWTVRTDFWTTFQHLATLRMDAHTDADVRAISQLAERWMESNVTPGPDGDGGVVNQAIRANSSTLRVRVGHRTFDEARRAWHALAGQGHQLPLSP